MPPGTKPDNRQRMIEQLDDRFSASGIRKRRVNRFFGGNLWLIWVQLVTGLKRAMDVLIALALTVVLLPVILLVWIVAKFRGGGIVKAQRLGRWGIAYSELSFARAPFASLPTLFNVLRGDMALVGPRSVSPGDVAPQDRSAWRRFNIRPGFICLWWIRKRANIAYGTESEVDSEYLDTQSLMGDLAIGLRAVPAAFFGEGISVAPSHIHFLGIPIDNLTMDEAVEEILTRASAAVATQVCFLNADCVNIAYRDAEYRKILQTADTVLADGIGVKLAGRILNTNIRQNVNGTDLFPVLCAALESHEQGLYLLGGKPGVSDDVAAWIHKNHPRVRLRGHRHGFFTPEELPSVIADIRASGAEILLVAFGAPKQDKWIREHLDATGVKVGIGVGGLFDFFSGRIPRAPVWMREIGMEWFYRFSQEPRRMWRRYFVGNAVFLFRVVRQRVTGNG